uniref:EOG090X0DL4 n=1 Tax=Eubosmina coregoni TaxID=186181 RepID=A0A4Y7LM68_9CRUS|nr:EOG090X0DL4 [Eubosmina coregoni]SVE70060.1 EOG090X0DL4 [Eubosmina coregoni]
MQAQQGRRTRTPSLGGTSSIYSYASTTRTMSRSMKSLRVAWYKRPLVQDAFFTDIQTGAMLTAIFSMVVSLFTIATAILDMYCLGMTKPGVTHYGFYIMSFQFVYVGNNNVRNCLIVFALISAIAAMGLFVTACILMRALRKEIEKKMIPWLFAAGGFFAWRTFAIIFASIVNDMIFGYHISMCLLWVVFILFGIFGWVIVYSLYLELSDLTKLEDLAHLRMGTMSSLNMTQSIGGSRPTTPHSTVSTAQAV